MSEQEGFIGKEVVSGKDGERGEGDAGERFGWRGKRTLRSGKYEYACVRGQQEGFIEKKIRFTSDGVKVCFQFSCYQISGFTQITRGPYPWRRPCKLAARFDSSNSTNS